MFAHKMSLPIRRQENNVCLVTPYRRQHRGRCLQSVTALLTVVDRAWLSSEVLIPFFSLTAFEIYTINHETEQFCEICCCLSVYVDAFMLRFSLVSILRMLLTSSECVSLQICCCQQCRRPVTKSNHQIALLRRFPVFRLCCCRRPLQDFCFTSGGQLQK